MTHSLGNNSGRGYMLRRKGSNDPDYIIGSLLDDNPENREGAAEELVSLLNNPEHHDYILQWIRDFFLNPKPEYRSLYTDYKAAYMQDFEWMPIHPEILDQLTVAEYNALDTFGISYAEVCGALTSTLRRLWMPIKSDEVFDIFWDVIEQNHSNITNLESLGAVVDTLAYCNIKYDFPPEKIKALNDIYSLVKQLKQPWEFGLDINLKAIVSGRIRKRVTEFDAYLNSIN